MNLPIEFTLPLHLRSEANGSHGHFRSRSAAVRLQRQQVVSYVMVLPGLARVTFELPRGNRSYPVARWNEPPSGPLVVTMTRVAPRELDSDNLARSMKAIRDQLAELLGVDDRDPRVTWVPAQRRGLVREYAVHVMIQDKGGNE